MTEVSPVPRTVLVCGGRDYSDRARVLAVLNGLHALHPIGALVHGAAAGADSLGAAWGVLNAEIVRAFPVDWDQHGRAAGPIRNQHMLDEGKPDLPGPTLTIAITALELEALIIHQHDRAQACAAQRDHNAEMIHGRRASYLLQQLAQIAPERVSPHKASRP